MNIYVDVENSVRFSSNASNSMSLGHCNQHFSHARMYFTAECYENAMNTHFSIQHIQRLRGRFEFVHNISTLSAVTRRAVAIECLVCVLRASIEGVTTQNTIRVKSSAHVRHVHKQIPASLPELYRLYYRQSGHNCRLEGSTRFDYIIMRRGAYNVSELHST